MARLAINDGEPVVKGNLVNLHIQSDFYRKLTL